MSLKSLAQLFCWVSLHLGLSDDFSWVAWGYTLLLRIPENEDVAFLSVSDQGVPGVNVV